MTGPNADDQQRLGADGAFLRWRLAGVAASIACTEDQVAETLERVAQVLPGNAARLQARAAQARQFATVERNWAAIYSHPC